MKIDRRNFLLASSAAILAQRNLTFGSINPETNYQRSKSDTAFSVTGKQVKVFTSAEKTGQRLSSTDTLTFKLVGQPKETQICVFVDPARQFQTFLGIGGALTDASAEVFAILPKEKQREILRAYYDENDGIGYKLARTNIHSCDFSSASYTYVTEGDKELKSFSVAHDKQYRIPLIKQVLSVTKGRLNIF